MNSGRSSEKLQFSLRPKRDQQYDEQWPESLQEVLATGTSHAWGDGTLGGRDTPGQCGFQKLATANEIRPVSSRKGSNQGNTAERCRPSYWSSGRARITRHSARDFRRTGPSGSEGIQCQPLLRHSWSLSV